MNESNDLGSVELERHKTGLFDPYPSPMRLPCLLTLITTPALAVDFVREVRPIFEKHCYECHGAEKQKNDYRLDIKAVADWRERPRAKHGGGQKRVRARCFVS
jgi:hypothetical protein